MQTVKKTRCCLSQQAHAATPFSSFHTLKHVDFLHPSGGVRRIRRHYGSVDGYVGDLQKQNTRGRTLSRRGKQTAVSPKNLHENLTPGISRETTHYFTVTVVVALWQSALGGDGESAGLAFYRRRGGEDRGEVGRHCAGPSRDTLCSLISSRVCFRFPSAVCVSPTRTPSSAFRGARAARAGVLYRVRAFVRHGHAHMCMCACWFYANFGVLL